MKTITLDKDISFYKIGKLSEYNEIIVEISRPSYIQGLDKTVWFRVLRDENSPTSQWYTAAYINTQFGYVKLNVALHINDVFVSSDFVHTNNTSAQTTAYTNVIGAYSNENTRENSVFAMIFADTSIIQGNEVVTVYGVPRQ